MKIFGPPFCVSNYNDAKKLSKVPLHCSDVVDINKNMVLLLTMIRITSATSIAHRYLL